jgi:asparagine synthase (glutamine-hydrolysing)
MCGILGLYNFQNIDAKARTALESINYRGKDHSKIIYNGNFAFGHNLHSVVDYVPQPLETKKGILVINCEIYNWRTLARKNKVRTKNDAELVLKLLDKTRLSNSKKISNLIQSLDGDFAFAYYSKKENKLILARDLIGVKPLVYFFDEEKKQLAFSSEKKALNTIGLNAVHLNPRKILVFDPQINKLNEISLKINPKKVSLKKSFSVLKKTFFSAVKKRIPKGKFGLLLSGGLDSGLIAKSLSLFRKKPVCFFSGIFDEENYFSDPKDYESVQKLAKQLGLELIVEKVSLVEFEKELLHIMTLIESSDPVRVGVASTIYYATKNISSKGIKVAFSGLGADELFAGYYRFRNSNNINKDCFSYLIKMYENDLYFEDIITMSNKVELRVPFLDKEFVELSLSLPSKLKLVNDNNCCVNKKILRELAVSIKLPREIALREKKAAQYGSNFDKAIEFLAKKHGFKSKADYLKTLLEKKHFVEHTVSLSQKNIPIAALISTGKDSLYALHLMEKQGYEVRCLIAIKPENKDSFMFHTPTIELAKLQAKSLGKRLLLVHTKGEKEKEVEELEKGLMLAKKMFKIEGICSGALYSNYQRERIERACEKHGLRHFAPLWHLDQEKYLKQVIASGFEIIITKIACYGMSEKWLGRKIDSQAIYELIQLNKKYGINVAGEGGEYETLVLDTPRFKDKIFVEFIVKMTNENTGEIELKKIELKRKN